MAATEPQTQQSLAIIGAGITGLSAALRAEENGQDPSQITIYEASNRSGGKIQTGYINGDPNRPVNMGAEFVDSDHKLLIDLCKKLNVPLKASDDQGEEVFQRPNGKRMTGEAFHRQFQSLHEQIIRDKQEVLAAPDGPLAQRINNLSMIDYLEELRQRIPANPKPGFWQRLWNLVTFRSNRVSPEITTMAMQAFASEVGQPPQHINALQYLHEASAELGSFLDSDCAFRVEGGTENIIKALEARLREKGVKFVHNSPLQKLEKSPGGKGLELSFDSHAAHADKVVLALPAYALGKIQGLDALGLPAQMQQAIGQTQYTNSLKFTIRLRDGVQPPKENFFANHGFQVWSAAPGEMTFLVNADKLDRMKAPQLVGAVLQSYAQSNGTTTDALFDRSRGSIVFSNPGKDACYASPAPGQARRLEHLTASLDKMVEHGVGVAGTYLPHQVDGGIGVGFMECGVASSQRVIDQLIQPELAQSQERQHEQQADQTVAAPGEWELREQQRRAQTAQQQQAGMGLP